MVLVVNNPPASAEDIRDTGLIPWKRAWQPTPVFLSGESHGQRTLAGYSPWGRRELDVTEVTYLARTRTVGLLETKFFILVVMWQRLARPYWESHYALFLQTRVWEERGNDAVYLTGLVCRSNEMSDSCGSALRMLKIYMGLRSYDCFWHRKKVSQNIWRSLKKKISKNRWPWKS